MSMSILPIPQPISHRILRHRSPFRHHGFSKARRRLPLVAVGTILFASWALLTGQSALAATATVAATIGPTAPYYTDDVTATVVVTGTGPTPTGSITGASDGGSAQIIGLVNGTARLELSFFTPGAHSFVYSYSGDSNYGASVSQTLSFTVADRPFGAVGSEYSFTNLYRIQNPNIGNLNFATVAVDSKSNLYLPNAVSNTISKFDPMGNVTPVPVTGLNRPDGIVLDSSDNIYVADSGNQRVVEITAGGTQSVLPITGLSDPAALAFDPAFQYLYVADQGNGNIVVYKLAAQTQTVIATGDALLSGIAVDANLNIFYSQFSNSNGGGNGNVYRLDHANYGAPANATTIFTGINSPEGLLLDPLGDLYIDSGLGLFVLDAQSHLSQISSAADQVLVVNGEFVMTSMAMDTRGKIYRAYLGDVFIPGAAADAGPATYDQSGIYNFQIYYQIPYGQTITAVKSPGGSQVYRLSASAAGPSAASYPLVDTVFGDSSVGSYDLDSNDSFGAGPWSSSVTVTTSDGAQHPIVAYGTGMSPSFSIAPGSILPQALTVSGVGGVAEDGAGTIYVSDPVGNAVLKLPASVTTPITLPFSGLNKPTQLAFDGLGAVYVLDSGSSRILKVDTQGNQSVVFDLSTQTALTSLSAFTMDGGTNLFLAGNAAAGGSAIYYLDTFGDQLLIASTANQPTALAVDFFGFVYSVDTEGTLNRFDSAGNRTQIATGLQQPVSVAVDASGTAYVAGGAGSGVTVVSPTGTKTPYPSDAPAADSLTNASAVAVIPDGSGSLVVGDNSGRQVFQILRGLPYTRPQQLLNLSFGDVSVGSSKTINAFLANTGNLTSQSFGVTSPSGDFALATDPAECITTNGASAFNPAFAPAATCGLTVTFSPTYTGAQSSYFNVFQANNSSEVLGGSDFSGNGVAATLPTIAPTTQVFQSTSVGATSAAKTSIITNGTAQAVNLSAGSLTDPTDFTDTDGCSGEIIQPGATCTVTFTFKPQSTGALTSTYSIHDLNTPNSPLTVALSGTGTGSSATLSISPSALPFPDTAPGSTSSAKTAILSNLTSSTLNLTPPTLSDATDFSISANTCAGIATIAPNGTCTISFTFNPASAGAKTSTFSIADINSTAPPIMIALSGDSISQPTVSFLPTVLGFGPVADGTSAVLSTTVTNGGSVAVPITGASVTGTGFSLTNNGCGSSVPANGSCQYGVTVSPTTIGPLTGTLTVTDSLGTQTVPLTATGTQGSTTNTVTPSSINFGNVTVGTYSATNVVTFTNNASSPVTIPSYSVNGLFIAAGNGNCLAATVVKAMGTCTYNIYLRPQTVGSYSGTFTVLDGITNPSVALTATATAAGSSPQVVLTPNPLTFANAPQGQGTVQTITLTNASAATILVEQDETTADAPFQVSLNALDQTACPAVAYGTDGVDRDQVSIPPGGFCSYQVTFPGNIAPDTTATGTITFHYAYPGTLPDYQVPASAFAYVATASVTANELTAADAVVTPTAIQFPATASGTTSPAQTVTVTNTGEEPLGFTSAILSGTNAANFKANPNCPASLAKNNTCQITVTFSPDESTNEFTAVLDVKTSTGDTNVTLNGGTNPSDFVLSTSTPGTQGPTNPTWVIDVTPLTASIGFDEPITFTSDLDKSFGTIVFTPNSVTPGAKAVSTTATLTRPSSSARLERPLVNLRKGWPILACFVFFISFGRRFRSVRGRKILLLIACIFLGIMTAKAKSSSPPTVTFTVTATSGSVSHTVELTYQPPS